MNSLQRMWFRYGGLVLPNTVSKTAIQLFTTPGPQRPMKDAEKELLSQRIERIELEPSGSVVHVFSNSADKNKTQQQQPRIALFHGWASRATQLAGFVKPLVDQGARVYAFDLPAHGESKGKQMHAIDLLHMMLDAQDQLGEFKGLIAHSMAAGAAIIAVNGDQRGRSISRQTRLVLIAGPSNFEQRLDILCNQLQLPPAARKAFYKNMAELTGYNIAQTGIFSGTNTKSFNLPLLAIQDLDDKEVNPRNVDEIAAAWAKDKIQVVKTRGLGHNRILKDPLIIKRCVDFVMS